MLHIPDIHLDIRKTQFYQDVYSEGELKGERKGEIKGELKGEIKIILNLLKRRFGELNANLVAQIQALNLNQLDYLAENLLDFKQLDELVNWLKQLNN